MSDLNTLIEIAGDDRQSSYRRRQAVSDLLKNHSSESETIAVVTSLLSGNDVSLKRDIVGAVKDSPSVEVLPAMKTLLNEDDDYLKRDVIQVIGKLGSQEELELVKQLASDSSFTVSYAAKTAVADIERRLTTTEVVHEVEPTPEPEELEEPEAEVVEEVIEESPVLETAQVDEIEEPLSEEAAEVEPEPVPAEPEKLVEREVQDEISAHEQKLPESLHANSIYGDESFGEVNSRVEQAIKSEISEKSPILSGMSNLEGSKNLEAFFAEESTLALSLYKQLNTYSDELPAKEAAVSEAKRQLTLLEADKADDVEASSVSVESEQKDVDDVKWEIKKATKELDDFEKESQSTLNTLIFMFSSDKKDEVVARKASLKKKIKELKDKLIKEESELEFHKNEKQSLIEPIKEMQKELDVKVKNRDAVIQKIIKAEKDINELIVRLLLTSDNTKLSQRLNFLAQSDSTMSARVADKIISLVSKVRADELECDKVVEEHSKLLEKSTESMVEIGKEISKSLVKKESSVKKEVNISANINFKEEEGFFSYSNASGTASGTGTAHGTMNVEQTEWRKSPNLETAIGGYSESFNNLGRKTADRELADIKYKMSRSVLDSYIDYLRSLIETDFGK